MNKRVEKYNGGKTLDLQYCFTLPKEGIERGLKKICTNKKFPSSYYGNQSFFTYIDKEKIVQITFSKKYSYRGARNFKREITLEITPKTSQTPKELTNLFKETGFEKINQNNLD